MKKLKIFSTLAAVALLSMAFTACQGNNEPNNNDPQQTDKLTVTPATAQMKVGDKLTVTANKTATWTVVSQTNAVTINATEGTTIEVTAVAEGGASLVATAGTEQEFCVITVASDGNQPTEGKTIEASEIYPVILDGVTFEANKDKVVADFRVNDETSHLYIWSAGETYAEGEGSGLNFFGNNEGYVALTVAAAGWSGGGFNLDASYDEAVNALIAKIVADPDNYYFHIGMKSVDQATHWLYLFGSTPGCDVVIGSADFYDADKGVNHPATVNFNRNGAWQSIDVSMASMVADLATITISNGVNIVSFLSGGVTGTQLNMDACYFYKK